MSDEGHYYTCVLGDASHVALEKTGFFTIEDKFGRVWVCREVNEAQASDPRIFARAADICEARGELFEKGLASRGTAVATLYCRCKEELPEKLWTEAPKFK